MNPFNQTTIGKNRRSVSIIGVGSTPFVETLKHPETDGLVEGELFGYAALQAMEDAGISPKDVQFYYHGCASPMGGSNIMSPNLSVAEWMGMRGKASVHHSEACCTGYLALDLAVEAIASGKYDVVLTGGIDFGDARAIPNLPAFNRKSFTFMEFQASTEWLFINDYSRYLYFNNGHEYCSVWYKDHANLSDDEIDKTLCQLAITARENAKHNPLAIDHVTYQELAKEAGYDDVMEYMQSDNNPKIGDTQRVSGLEHKCDGATCLVLCATDLVSKYTKNVPIEVLGIGNSALEQSNPILEITGTVEATRQVYEMTGVKPEEIDLLYVNDFIISSQLMSAEVSGYIPDKQAWKYVLDGRTRYDGDKPINPNGGRTAFGHAHAASGLVDMYDAVLQMRGVAGAHQVKKCPKTVFLRGYGGGQNLASVILRTADVPGQVHPTKAPYEDSEIKLEKLVRTYYETLEKGKVLGRKCPECGNIEWPPVYACNACGCKTTEWVEMSGDAELVEIYVPTAMTAKPAYTDLEPYAYAWVKTAEGPERNAMVRGVTRENAPYIREHLPYPCHFDIVQREGFKTAVFAIDPIDKDGNPIVCEEKKPDVKAEETPAPEAAPDTAAPAVSEDSETLARLKKLVAQQYRVDEEALTAESVFEKDIKGPSVLFVGLVARIEDEFDAVLSMTQAAAAKTMGALAALIDSLREDD